MSLTGQRGLGNVGSHDDLPSTIWSRLEDLGLEVGWHLRVDGQDRQWRSIIQLV